MQIEVLDAPYPGKIITDDDILDYEPAKRIVFTDRMLARHLGFSKQLIRAYFEARLIHVASWGERAAGHGMCAEEIAGLILMAELHQRFQIPFKEAALYGVDLILRLQQYPEEARIALVVCESNRKYYIKIMIGPDDLIVVDPTVAQFITIFDATLLVRQVEAGIHEEPLRFPRASSCVVKA